MKHLLFLLTSIVCCCSLQAQVLYGTTSAGGTGNAGTITELDVATNTLTAAYSLQQGGKHPQDRPVQASDGKLYGTTNEGGLNNRGMIYSFDPATAAYTQRYSFNFADGATPQGGLIQASNGKLYGTASGGGSHGYGVIYSFDPVTDTYTKLQEFDGTNGQYPYGSLLQASDGKLYGMTSTGGAANSGYIFSFDPANGTFNNLYTIGTFAHAGRNPKGSLIQASDGKLYGMTSTSADNGVGAIFSFDIATRTYTQLYNFDGINGANPYGSLLQASDGKLYGTTMNGGSANDGVIFSFDPVTSTYTKLKEFNGTDGANPQGSFIKASDGKLYGTAANGSSTNDGVIFSFDPATDTYNQLKEFNGADGANPLSSLLQASDGKLYSVTFQGGSYGFGVLFSFDPTTGTYTQQKVFEGNSSGASVNGGLVKAKDGKLYGMTYEGGTSMTYLGVTSGLGVIFSFDPVTSTYTKLKEFNGTDGAFPKGSLIQASNGKLYGMTSGGGNNNYGVIFSFDPATGTYTKLVEFNNLNGTDPLGGLLQANDGKLYGMTKDGGSNNFGVLFSFDPATNTYTVLYNYNGFTGSYPVGSLIQASDSKLYGMTNGSVNTIGVIFSFDPATGTYTKLKEFDSTSGLNPEGSLVQASNGNLYGMTVQGGMNNDGVMFSFNPLTGAYTKLVEFDSTGGSHPYGIIPDGSLMQASNGKLYGMTHYGGSNNGGVAFTYDPATAAYTKLADFTNATGINPTLAFFTEGQMGGTGPITGINQRDSLALVDLYNSTGGSNWRNHTNWLTTQPVSTWYGVTVTNNRVTKLELIGNRLGGSLNSSLGDLDSLMYLDLRSNSFSGSIPSTFGYLHQLSYLDLSSNFLSDRIPSTLGNDTSLTTLILYHNQLSSGLPASFEQLKMLKLFYAWNNSLSGTLDVLGNCTRLDTLNVSNNQLTGTLPSTFKNLTDLSYLDLSANQLSGKITDIFADNTPLTYINLSDNPFCSQKIPTFFKKFTQLQTLELSNDNLTGIIPAGVAKLKSLVSLELGLNHLEGTIPSTINSMPSLTLLDVSSNNLSGELPPLFHNFSLTNFTLTANDNNLTYTRNPQWNSSMLFGSTGLKLYNNQFTFDGLEYLNEKFDGVTDYPQAPLTIHTHDNKLAVSAGGTLSQNTYTWYKTGTSDPVAAIKGDSTYQPATSGNYYVNINNSIVKFLTLTTNPVDYTVVSGATSNSTLTVSVYPNPVRGMITLNNLNNKANNKITIADMSGYVWLSAMSHQQSSLRMDASRLKSGNYLITVTDGKQIKTIQFVKE